LARAGASALVILSLLAAAGAAAGVVHPVVETADAAIEGRAGDHLRLRYAAADRPVVRFKPARGAWDWSTTGTIVVPVTNPGSQALTLILSVESAAGGAVLSGKAAIAPEGAGDLVIRIDGPPPRAMGMIGGPPPAGAGAAKTLPVTATTGSVDASQVGAVRLEIAHPAVAGRLFVGPLSVVPRNPAEASPYAGIVDQFGQFRGRSWPGKIGSVAALRAAAGREAGELARWLAAAPRRDPFGGLVGVGRFAATGFFRTECRGGRWWLVTPAGNPFFSIGIDVVAASGATYIEGREFMFRNLPPRDGPAAAHWRERDDRRGLGAQRGRAFDHGAAFDFYTANLERKFGADWREEWRREAAARLAAWGFNTIGNWSDPRLWAMHRLPYTVPLSPEGQYATISSGEDWWGPLADPFDPRFAEAADRMARDAAARFGADPWLVGYFVGNELPWGKGWSKKPGERYSVALGALAAGRESPAKAALVAQLVATYGEPGRLGQAWGLALGSWDELRRAGFALPEAALERPAVTGDLEAFDRHFADAYFRTVAEALRRHDPDHLYLGSRFAWQTPEAVAACARWCDVVSFNRYRRSIGDDGGEWAKFHALGKPALIGEFHFGSTDRGLFWEGLAGAGSERERGPAYARYLASVADNPDFVGAHWFAYLDEPLVGRTLDGENGHIGFVDVADQPYRGLVAAAQRANASVLRRLARTAE
jgi:hypothetical protein